MEVFTQHWQAWLILIVLISATVYTMQIIRQEGTSFRQDSYYVQFGELRLMIPRWWSITQQEQHSIRFERTDTHYDWYAQFTWHADETNTPLTEILEKKIQQEELDYDRDDVHIETDSRVLFRDSNVQEQFQEIIRVEGKASQHITERVYFDIYLFRRLNETGYFLCESRSSVLNGSVEGPYFEESLAELELVNDSFV